MTALWLVCSTVCCAALSQSSQQWCHTRCYNSLLCCCTRFVDCDVLVSEVRETSRKPDEMYPLLERLSPGERQLQ